MRELLLNDASIAAADQRTAMDWLVGIAKGISLLFNKKIVQNTLRTSRPLQDIHYRGNSSLWELILALGQHGLMEEYRFLMRSSVKSPLTNLTTAQANYSCGTPASAIPAEFISVSIQVRTKLKSATLDNTYRSPNPPGRIYDCAYLFLTELCG